jgi:hypothetical protein
MFMQIVTQVSGRITALFTTVYTLVKAQLLLLVSKLRVSITQAYLNVVNRLQSLLALLELSIKVLAVNLIILVQSIKAEVIAALTKLWGRGLQLLTTARLIPPPAPTAPKRKKGKVVGLTKSARSRTKEKIIVPTPTAHLLTPGGLKLRGRVSLLLQRVKAMLKVGA